MRIFSSWLLFILLLFLCSITSFFVTLRFLSQTSKQQVSKNSPPIIIIQEQEPDFKLPDVKRARGGNPAYALKLMVEADKLKATAPQKALKRYLEALNMYAQNVTIWERAGKLAMKQKDLLKASRLFKSALILREQSKSPYAQTSALYWLATIESKLKNYDAAIGYKNRELTIEQKRGRPKRIAAIHRDLAYYYRDSKRKSQAEQHFRKGIKVAEQSGDQLAAAYQYIPLGFLVRDGKTNQQSCAMWKKAHVTFSQKGVGAQVKNLTKYLGDYKCST